MAQRTLFALLLLALMMVPAIQDALALGISSRFSYLLLF
jgi:hypothetical protein|nr:hypothetical protein [Intestinirhabdus alba]